MFVLQKNVFLLFFFIVITSCELCIELYAGGDYVFSGVQSGSGHISNGESNNNVIGAPSDLCCIVSVDYQNGLFGANIFGYNGATSLEAGVNLSHCDFSGDYDDNSGKDCYASDPRIKLCVNVCTCNPELCGWIC